MLMTAKDGEGIRGICEIIVLQNIKYRIRMRRNLARKPKPCDCLQLIGGKRTSGLIAILLNRFRMTATQCIQEYKSLAKKVFGMPKLHVPLIPSQSGLFSARLLEVVVVHLTWRVNQKNDPYARLIEERAPKCRWYL
jgi:hypothetical protein